MKLLKAEIEWAMWAVGLKRYCTPCDKIYWTWRRKHRRHRCFWAGGPL